MQNDSGGARLNREPKAGKDKAVVLALLLALGASGAAVAADETEEKEKEKSWSDEAELSYVTTGGNSEVQTLAAKNRYKLGFAEDFTFLWKLEALRGKTDGVLTAERYFTDLRLEYAFDHAYVYGSTGRLRDTFAGLRSRTHRSGGIGYKLLDGPASFLKLEAGVNDVEEVYTDSGLNPDRQSTEGRLFGEYAYAFTKKNKFTQSLEFLQDTKDSKRYRANSETALIAALNDRFSIKLSYELRYNRSPVPDTLRRTDRVLSTALVANF